MCAKECGARSGSSGTTGSLRKVDEHPGSRTRRGGVWRSKLPPMAGRIAGLRENEAVGAGSAIENGPPSPLGLAMTMDQEGMR